MLEVVDLGEIEVVLIELELCSEVNGVVTVLVSNVVLAVDALLIVVLLRGVPVGRGLVTVEVFDVVSNSSNAVVVACVVDMRNSQL